MAENYGMCCDKEQTEACAKEYERTEHEKQAYFDLGFKCGTLCTVFIIILVVAILFMIGVLP